MNIIIDGRQVLAKPEDTILLAARREGIYIPSLCFNQATEPTHSCRLCMVEIQEKGRTFMVASCAYKVKEGLVVTTESETLRKVRNTLLQLLYAQAPENPAIVALMERYQVVPKEKLAPKEGQCILCGLCVEACKKLGASSISTIHRGVTKEVNTPYGIQAKNCIGCASCAGFCPTHCITVEDTEEGRTIWNKKFKWARCEVCGAIVGTEQHYKASTGDTQVVCPDCRRKTMTDVFADTLGERY